VSNIWREEHQKPLTWDDMQVSEEVYNVRFNTCQGCEFWVENQIGEEYNFETEEYESYRTQMQCTQCNCDMEEKAWFTNAKCPVDKW